MFIAAKNSYLLPGYIDVDDRPKTKEQVVAAAPVLVRRKGSFLQRSGSFIGDSMKQTKGGLSASAEKEASSHVAAEDANDDVNGDAAAADGDDQPKAIVKRNRLALRNLQRLALSDNGLKFRGHARICERVYINGDSRALFKKGIKGEENLDAFMGAVKLGLILGTSTRPLSHPLHHGPPAPGTLPRPFLPVSPLCRIARRPNLSCPPCAAASPPPCGVAGMTETSDALAHRFLVWDPRLQTEVVVSHPVDFLAPLGLIFPKVRPS